MAALSQADILIALAEEAEVFHSPDGIAYADINVDEHRETHPIRRKGFRSWLTARYYKATRSGPSSGAMQSAVNTIEAKALFNGPERTVYVRVARLDDSIFLDLGNRHWQTVRIGKHGWAIINTPRVRFHRPAGMRPLPVPEKGGSAETLRSFLNVRRDDDFVLAVAWLLAALGGAHPYPVLVLAGEHGSAKSTFAKVMRGLCDPNKAPLRTLPREDRDLFISATNGYLLAFDNISQLPAWLSDTLCRLATGGGFATRQLYTDQDEILLDTVRPIILNGIAEIVVRPDLADRGLFLTLEQIAPGQRRDENEFWGTFERERPRILGALLDAVARGLRRWPPQLRELPRMADFARWAIACEGVVWPAGAFERAYAANRAGAVERVIESDSVAEAVRVLMDAKGGWEGTASQLLVELARTAGKVANKAKTWPANPRALSARMRLVAPSLRAIGIDYQSRREGRERSRIIRLQRIK